jgi:hypothetical protein
MNPVEGVMTNLEKEIRDGILGLGNVAPISRRDPDATKYEDRDDANWSSGSREFDEGGGVASEVGGSRNYHHSGGATGGDLGNRPE